jgi:hypothetical protein
MGRWAGVVDTENMDERTDEQLIDIVAGFVLRARRILADSMMAGETALEALAAGARFAIRKGGNESLERRLPNEETLGLPGVPG